MSIGTQDGADVSYLSDTIIVLGYFERAGDILRCLAVVKKKAGEHDTTIRELLLTPAGVQIGAEPLRQFRNLLVPNARPDDGPPGGAAGPGKGEGHG